MVKSNIRSYEAAAFKAKLGENATAGSVGDQTFSDAIYTAVSQFGLDEAVFRDSFGLSKGTVEHWMQGQSLPQPQIRPKIFLWLQSQMEDKKP